MTSTSSPNRPSTCDCTVHCSQYFCHLRRNCSVQSYGHETLPPEGKDSTRFYKFSITAPKISNKNSAHRSIFSMVFFDWQRCWSLIVSLTCLFDWTWLTNPSTLLQPLNTSPPGTQPQLDVHTHRNELMENNWSSSPAKRPVDLR